jgi:hypothetical protein
MGLSLAVLLFYGLFFFSNQPRGRSIDEQIQPQNDPQQTNIVALDASPLTVEQSGTRWTITPRAEYRIAARVLHHEKYYLGWQSNFSPVDLALGWGKLADPKADDWISWSQNMRWYFYRWENGSPFSGDYIMGHSANVHVIPFDQNLKNAVLKLKRNNIVFLEGNLIDIDGTNAKSAYWWHTSLSREDTGNGSCELLWLKRAIIQGIEYR